MINLAIRAVHGPLAAVVERSMQQNEEPPVRTVHHEAMRCGGWAGLDGDAQIGWEVALPRVQLKTMEHGSAFHLSHHEADH